MTLEQRPFVYFIQRGKRGPIKIGVARNPEARLRDLQVANAEELRLLRTVPGSFEVEWHLHAAFEADRVRGEWYRPTERLLRLIRHPTKLEELIAGAGTDEASIFHQLTAPEANPLLCATCRVNLECAYKGNWQGEPECAACVEAAPYREMEDVA